MPDVQRRPRAARRNARSAGHGDVAVIRVERTGTGGIFRTARYPGRLRRRDLRGAASGTASSLALLAIGAAASACASARPAAPAAASLYKDVRRMVDLSEAAGWKIDRIEYEKLLPDTLLSLCRTPPELRGVALEWVEERLSRYGRSVVEAYRGQGDSLKGLGEELTLTRVRDVLKLALDSADADCPFWIEPSESFRGRQLLDDRWMLSFGGGGKGIAVVQAGEADVNFGGAGRLLAGRAVGETWTYLLGIEIGASASFPRDADGERSNLVLGVDTVIPAVVRVRRLNTYAEVEAGYFAHTREDTLNVSHGLHIGGSFGGSALRQRWFLPGAAFGVSLEQTFGADPMTLLKVGFRVAIDLPLSGS